MPFALLLKTSFSFKVAAGRPPPPPHPPALDRVKIVNETNCLTNTKKHTSSTNNIIGKLTDVLNFEKTVILHCLYRPHINLFRKENVSIRSNVMLSLFFEGEDRWMCTLMIQRGWRLTYCAAAVDGTYCPETFDEFYKQRRRWTPSTLANLVLVIREWKTILEKNEHISFLFILYQTFLVCSSVIG